MEGVRGRLVPAPEPRRGDHVGVLVDPEGASLATWAPEVIVDARMRKRPPADTSVDQARLVVGLGPGFRVGVHAHAVVETARGHDLGRVLWSGEAAPNTGVPGEIGGYREERVLRAPAAGVWKPAAAIGDPVAAGQEVGRVDGTPVVAAVGGVVRGLLRGGLEVRAGEKLGDVDPRGERRHCFTVSDKANAVAGGVLEAVLARYPWGSS
ncbi:MAG: EF2563 family selenium-dependent molybdenum hydroxylase system protein [Nitrospirae bacterium]|nr:MAG: EF2563 family selenium-dependent molybdenum hydroxylase system protein [Nitrospirota bacterium]